MGEHYHDRETAQKIVSSLVGKRLILKMKQMDEEKDKVKKDIIGIKRHFAMGKRKMILDIEQRVKVQYKKIVE